MDPDINEDILDLYNVNDNMLDIPGFSPKSRKSRVNLFALSPSEQLKLDRDGLGSKSKKDILTKDDFFITPSKRAVNKENQADNIMFRSPAVTKKNALQEVFQSVSHDITHEPRSANTTPAKGSGVYQSELLKPSKLKMPSPSPSRKIREKELNNTISHIPSQTDYSFTSPTTNEHLSTSFHEPSASSAYISRLRSLTAEINPSLPQAANTHTFSHMSQADKEAQLEVIKQRLSQLKRTAMEVSTIIPTAEPRKNKLTSTLGNTSTERVIAQKTAVDSTPQSSIKANTSLSQTSRLNTSLRSTSNTEIEVPTRLNRTLTSSSLRGLSSTMKTKVESSKPSAKVSKPHVEVTRSAVKPVSSYSVVRQSVPQTASSQRTVSKTSSLSKTTKIAEPLKTASAKSTTTKDLGSTKRPLSLKETFELANKKHKNSL